MIEIQIGWIVAPFMIIASVGFFYSIYQDIKRGDRLLDIEMKKDLNKEDYERITGKSYDL
jgi:hypothetical protein